MAQEAVKTSCICENQKDCKDISSAFWILKDPRSGFLELRPSTEGGAIASDSEKFEDACFRHLRPTNEEQIKRQDSSPLYVALHHFPPEIVLLCVETGERSPPVLSALVSLCTIPEPTRKDIELNLGEEDRALIEEAKSVGAYHVFPNYGLDQARSDVKQGLKKVVRTEKKRRKETEQKIMASSKQSSENAPASPTNVINSSSHGPQSPLKEGGKQLSSPKHTSKDLDHGDDSTDCCSNSSLEPTAPSRNKEKEASDVLKFIEEESLDVQELKVKRIAGIVWEEHGSSSTDTESEGELQHDNNVSFDQDEAHHIGKESCQAIDFMPSDLSLQSSGSNDADSRLEPVKSPRSEKRFLHSRSESMPILSVIESKRRVSMSLRLDSVKLEWSCYRGLIKDIVQETDRVDVIIQSSFQALEGYVDSMHAISSDSFLDDRGNVVKRTRRQEKIATQRSQVAQGVDDKESSMLNLLFISFDQMAQSLDENIPALEEGAQEMAALKLGLQMRADALIESGERALAEIEQYEANGQDAWNALVKSANTRYDAAKTRPNAPLASKAGSSSKIGTAHDDHWLSEASYKSAVVMILCGWESQCQELKLLYQKALQLDEYRRDKTRQLLLTFLPRQRRFFRRVNEALDVSFTNLEVGRISRDAVDEEIEKVIGDLSRANLTKEHPHHSSIMNRCLSNQPDLKVHSMSNNGDVLQGGIFKSKLVQDMKVFEVKTRSWSPWKLALGVFTVGNYFHLFDVHDDSMEINLGNATVEEAISRVTSTKPDISLVLSSCNCRHDSSKSVVEISIGTDNAFRKLLKRKICVRMSTFAETSLWMANLDRLRDEAAAALERQRVEAATIIERQRVEAEATLVRQRVEAAAKLERQRSFKKSKEVNRKKGGAALDRSDSESAIQAFV